MVIIGGIDAWRACGCADHEDGGASVCSNSISVRRDLLEGRRLAPIKVDLLSPDKLEDIKRHIAQKIAASAKKADHARAADRPIAVADSLRVRSNN
jgi:hypothetical protein